MMILMPSYRITATAIYDIAQAREKFARGLQIKLDRSKANGSWSDANVMQQLTDVFTTLS